MAIPSVCSVAPDTDTVQAAGPSLADDVSTYLRFRALTESWETRQPGLDDVVGVAGLVRSWRDPLADIGQRTVDQAGYGFGAREGRSFFLGISPGLAQLRVEDETRRVRSEHRQRVATVQIADALAASVDENGCLPAPNPWSAGEIVEWSSKSRSRMYWRILSLDLSTWADMPGSNALVTLTLPGDWQGLVPRGKDFKALVRKLRMRWTRALGKGSWACIWKLEFQERGAPHWHGLKRVPALVEGDGGYDSRLGYKVTEIFTDWLSRTWAECVGADDTVCHRCWAECECETPDTEYRRHLAAGTGVDFAGPEYSDPRRIATYFAGHSSKHTDGKEYQHIVPLLWRGRGRGPGRFWGYSGLGVALVEVEVTQREHYALARVLRKVKRARDGKLARLRAARGLPARSKRWQASYSLGGRGGICGGLGRCQRRSTPGARPRGLPVDPADIERPPDRCFPLVRGPLPALAYLP